MIAVRSVLLASILVPSLVAAQTAPAAQPSRADVMAAARDVMQKAVYCTFITIGEDGQPQARVVDPTAPDANLTIWIGTNPLTRKVKRFLADPRNADTPGNLEPLQKNDERPEDMAACGDRPALITVRLKPDPTVTT